MFQKCCLINKPKSDVVLLTSDLGLLVISGAKLSHFMGLLVALFWAREETKKTKNPSYG